MVSKTLLGGGPCSHVYIASLEAVLRESQCHPRASEPQPASFTHTHVIRVSTALGWESRGSQGHSVKGAIIF